MCRLAILAALAAALAAGVAGAATRPPIVSGTDPVTGKRVSLDDYRGRPVVINIWASWCPGCNQEAPAIHAFARAHPHVMLGVDTQDSIEGARRFYLRWDLAYPSVFDADGRIALTLGMRGIPTTIFLNARHRVVVRTYGSATRRGLEANLRRATRP